MDELPSSVNTTVVVPPSSSAWIWIIIILIIIILIVAIVVLTTFFRRPTAPPPPINFSGTTTGATTVQLTWSHPPGFAPTGYVIYVDSNPSLSSAMITTVPGNTTSLPLALSTGCWFFTIASQGVFSGQTVTGPYLLPLLMLCLNNG